MAENGIITIFNVLQSRLPYEIGALFSDVRPRRLVLPLPFRLRSRQQRRYGGDSGGGDMGHHDGTDTDVEH
jgi:hypothetical protein